MIINGIDLAGLEHQASDLLIPEPVQGRIVHIDADFLAYEVSYEKADDPKTFEDMKHNAELRVATIKSLAGATGVHLHLTPATSDKGGRYDLALLKEYQGNREDKPKPRYLHIIREWMGQHFPATLWQFAEADDGMSSAQYRAIKAGQSQLSIIASKDKDLRMVPGLQLDWDTGQITDCTGFGKLWRDEKGKVRGYGHKWFWFQMLTGDTADNISGLPGLGVPAVVKYYPPVAYTNAKTEEARIKQYDKIKPKKCGPVTALELLEGIETDKEAMMLVKDLYKMYGNFVDWRSGQPIPWQSAFLSEAQLLWMRVDPLDRKDVFRFIKEIANA